MEIHPMLQELNERFKGVIAWFIVLLIGVTFLLFGMQQYQQSHQSQGIVAKVNGKRIFQHEFHELFKRMYGQYSAAMPEMEQSTLKKRLLDDMIRNQVSADSAHTLGFDVATTQIDQTIVGLPYFQEDGKFSPALYQRALSAGSLTHRDFQNRLRDDLLRNQQHFAIVNTEFVLPNELDHQVISDSETRNYRYLAIQPEHVLQQTHVSATEIEAYYAEHRLEFVTPEQVRVDYVTLSLADIKASIHPKASLKKEQREQWVTDTAQKKYAQALELLADWSYQVPDSLQTVADKLGLTIHTTDWFTRTGDASGITHDKPFINAAFSDDVFISGNNSAPITLDNGQVVVLRIHEQQLAQEQPLAQVKQAVTDKVRYQKARLAAAELGQQLLTANSVQRDQLLTTHQLNWLAVKDSALHRHAEQNDLPLVHQLAFALPAQVGLLKGRAHEGGYYLVELQQINPGKSDALDTAQRTALAQRLAQEQGTHEYDAYLKQQVKLAKVSVL
jgi:hypothetical protein